MGTASPVILEIAGRTLTSDERYLAYAALLAQVDDVHALIWDWTQEQVVAAESLAKELEGKGTAGRTLALCIAVPIYDLDHPDLSDAEWDEADRLVEMLAQEFGR